MIRKMKDASDRNVASSNQAAGSRMARNSIFESRCGGASRQTGRHVFLPYSKPVLHDTTPTSHARERVGGTHADTEWRISEIKIGDRCRKELGDIDELASSIAEVGLLHKIVIRSDGVLIAGERRLTA
jgi:ParB-like nuclease domain